MFLAPDGVVSSKPRRKFRRIRRRTSAVVQKSD
jgi:hypothetical protein